MDPVVVTVVVVAVIVLVVVALLAAAARRRKEAERREHLQERFGPEYDRAVQDSDDTRAAEARLARAEAEREKLEIRPLTPESRTRRNAEWQTVQADFVTSPVEAVDSADRLVLEVMTERGYPSDDDDQRLSLLAADHAETVQHYRTADSHKARFHSGEGSTEDLRRAFVEYRQLFTVLVEEGADTMADPDTRPAGHASTHDGTHRDGTHRDETPRDGTHRDETHRDETHRDETPRDGSDDLTRRDDVTRAQATDRPAVDRPAGERRGDHVAGDAPVGQHAGRHEVDLRDSRDPEPTPVEGATSTRMRDDRV